MTTDQPQPALLFMPDISGFTQFVNDTEILHSQQIVQELLETLIECNQIGLRVGEIEGDAIFFYKLGNKPDIATLLRQVEIMFTTFHQHLKLYDQQRICPCKACESAVKLSLKIVSHYGEVTDIAVKDHKKLFGKDVIVIHRLLKNNLGNKEYVLLTDRVVDGSAQTQGGLPNWYAPHSGTERYDVGEVQFYFSDLAALHNTIPPIASPKYNSAAKTYVAFTEDKQIRAPIANTFAAIFDLPQRTRWMQGVKAIELVTNDHVPRIGTKHRCVIGEKNNPVIVTESVTITPDYIEMVEMDEKGGGGCRYRLEKVSEQETKLSVDMLVKNHWIVKLMFNAMMRSKYMKSIRQSLENLQVYLEPKPVEQLVG
ncbi:MAG TPA: DUF2652 domain-containing protein [Chitinophagaceae bacterium]|nr:DUF2652 domain-containing protein [Chitinophagaceae bacterium]